MTETVETAAVAEKFVPEVRNGQSARRPGTAGQAAWDICDAISARNGRPASASEVVAEGTAAGRNPGQLRAAYSKWRKFHGLQGTRIDNPEKAALTEAKVAEKAAKAQAKLDGAVAKAQAKADKAAANEQAKLDALAAKTAKAEQVAADKAAKAAAKLAAAAEAAAETAPEAPTE